MPANADLFADTEHAKPPRQTPRVIAHMTDAGMMPGGQEACEQCNK